MGLTNTHKAYFEAPRAIAQLSDFPRVKIGAVAVYKHHIISSGCNLVKTSPLQKKYNIYRFSGDYPHSLHAETSCLKSLIGRKDIDFKYVDLYIYREGKNHELALSRPCPSCLRLITELGIRNIYYTNNGGFSHEEILH